MRYITGSRMLRLGDGHVDLGAQRARAVRKLAGLHALEQIQVLFDGAVAVGALLARLGQRAAVLAHFLGGQIAHVGLAGADQLHGPFVQLAEIVGGVEEAVFPVEAQPADVVHDGIDVLGLFLCTGWCRRSADWSCRRTRPPVRNSGRSTWRGRCADSRSAPEESACARGRRTCRSSGRRG